MIAISLEFRVSGFQFRNRTRNSEPETRNCFLELLDFRFACGANPQLLAGIKVDVFAPLAHNARRPDARANRCADGSAAPATEDGSDDSADSGCRANFSDVPFGRVFTFYAAFLIDFADALARSCLQDFDHV